MKLSEHVEHIRQLIDQAFRNRLGRLGISNRQLGITNGSSFTDEQTRIINIYSVFKEETGTVADAYEKLVEELTFTLFNRLAALKVMEAHTLHPEIVTRRESHGGRSFAHLAWLEQKPDNKEANRIEKIESTTFKQLGFKEREHLQEMIANYPSCLNEDCSSFKKSLMVFMTHLKDWTYWF